MTDGYLLNLRMFSEVRDDKAQALKPLEEAAEVFGAWQELDSMRRSPFFSAWRDMRDDLIDECLDTVQATVNLLAAVGATQGEVDAAIMRGTGAAGGSKKWRKTEPRHPRRQGSEDEPAAQSGECDGRRPTGHREAQSTCKSGDKMKFEIIERHIIDVPDSELTDDERPLGKMTLDEVLDVIAENPHRFIEQYEVYREEVIRLGGKL